MSGRGCSTRSCSSKPVLSDGPLESNSGTKAYFSIAFLSFIVGVLASHGCLIHTTTKPLLSDGSLESNAGIINDFPAYKSVVGMLRRGRSTRSSKPDGSLESNAGIMVYFNDFPAYKSVVGM